MRRKRSDGPRSHPRLHEEETVYSKMPHPPAVEPICVACVGDGFTDDGGPCPRCGGTGCDPDPAAPAGITPLTIDDVAAVVAEIRQTLAGFRAGRQCRGAR